MFKDLLKTYTFVLCASLSSTACIAMEMDPWDSATKHYQTKNFDAGFEAILPLIEENPVKATDLMAKIFADSPQAIKHFDEMFDGKIGLGKKNTEKDKTISFEEQNKIINRLNKLQPPFLNAVSQSRKSITPQLDVETLEALSARYSRVSRMRGDPNLSKTYLEQAIWYSIMSAKADCSFSYRDQLNSDSSYDRLLAIIDGKIVEKQQYIPYYTFLIPLLEAEDKEALTLFNKVLFASEGALNWIEQYIENLQKNKKSPSQLRVLENAMAHFREERGRKLYEQAKKLWDQNPKDAIQLLVDAEDKSKEAKEKLRELRQLKSYTHQAKNKENIHEQILKELDRERGIKYYNSYLESLKKASRKNVPFSKEDVEDAGTALYLSAELNNPAAKEAVKKLKKSKAYKNPPKTGGSQPSDIVSRIAIYYKAFEGLSNILDEHTADESRTNTENITPTNLISAETSPNNTSIISSATGKQASEKDTIETYIINPQGVSSPQERAQAQGYFSNMLQIMNAIGNKDGAVFYIPPEGKAIEMIPPIELKDPEKAIISSQDKDDGLAESPLQKQRATRKTLSRTASEKAQKPEENVEKPQTNNTPVNEMPQKTEEQNEKSLESSVVEKKKHHKHRAQKEKGELPNQDHEGSTSQEESHDLYAVPTKKQRTLQRADSVRDLPKERPTLKRTASVGHMPKVVEPTADTQKKSKTHSLKKGVAFLLPKKKAAPPVEKKDPSPSHSKKSSNNTNSGVSQSEEKLSKSEGSHSHSHSKKKGSSEKPVVTRTLFFANKKARQDCISFVTRYEKKGEDPQDNHVNKLLEEIKRDPFGKENSIGNPHQLTGNYAGCWARSINDGDRIVYSVEPDDSIKIHEVGEHYQRS